MRIDTKAIIAGVQANRARLRSCPRHRFEAPADGVTLFKKHTCKTCFGQMDLAHVGSYIDGYVAHGGTADDIWPGWGSKKKEHHHA